MRQTDSKVYIEELSFTNSFQFYVHACTHRHTQRAHAQKSKERRVYTSPAAEERNIEEIRIPRNRDVCKEDVLQKWGIDKLFNIRC